MIWVNLTLCIYKTEVHVYVNDVGINIYKKVLKTQKKKR